MSKSNKIWKRARIVKKSFRRKRISTGRAGRISRSGAGRSGGAVAKQIGKTQAVSSPSTQVRTRLILMVNRMITKRTVAVLGALVVSRWGTGRRTVRWTQIWKQQRKIFRRMRLGWFRLGSRWGKCTLIRLLARCNFLRRRWWLRKERWLVDQIHSRDRSRAESWHSMTSAITQ